MFEEFDKDNSGFLDISNLAAVFKQLGMDVPEKYLQSILNDFDYKNNGKVELDEFCALMAKSAQAVDP